MEDGKGADYSYEFLGTTFMNNQIGEKPFLGSSHESSRGPGMQDGKGCEKLRLNISHLEIDFLVWVKIIVILPSA